MEKHSTNHGKLKVCFITDGGRQMGMGHVQQSTTLAKELKKKADIFFLTKSDDIVFTAILEAGFDVTALQNDEQILDFLNATNPEIVVFDKIDVAEKLARNIRDTLAARLVIFTNLTAANKYADIAVLQRAQDLSTDAASRFRNITYTDESTNTLYCYGPKYWVLRPEFYEYKKRGKAVPAEAKRILLAFGGSDPSNLTSVVLGEILEMGKIFRIDVILGGYFSHEDSVKTVLEQYSEKMVNVTLHRNIKNVAELMYKADLAITSAGMSMFEALCVGTPVIVIPQDQLQRDTYQGVMRMLESDDLKRLGEMIERAEFSSPLDEHIIAMEIGNGVQELVKLILHPVVR